MSQSLGDGRRHGALLLGAFYVLLALIAAVFLMTSADHAAADNCNTVSGAPFPNSPCDNRKHQSDEGGTTAFVTLVDETGSAWRVFARAIEWDAAGRLDLVYRSGTCGGFGHCTSVKANSFVNYTCRANPGFVSPSYTGGHFDGGTYIRFNTKCTQNAWTARDREVVVCQEEGHVAGVGHEPSPAKSETCMATPNTADYDIGTWEETPRQHDFVMLDDVIYTHND